MYDPSAFTNIAAGKEFQSDSQMDIRLKQPGTLYAIRGGAKVVYGYGTHFMGKVKAGTVFSCSVPASARVLASNVVQNADEPVFTNDDKRPEMSAIEQFVTLELRKMKLTQMAEQAERRLAKKSDTETESLTEETPAEPETDSEQTEENTETSKKEVAE